MDEGLLSTTHFPPLLQVRQQVDGCCHVNTGSPFHGALRCTLCRARALGAMPISSFAAPASVTGPALAFTLAPVPDHALVPSVADPAFTSPTLAAPVPSSVSRAAASSVAATSASSSSWFCIPAPISFTTLASSLTLSPFPSTFTTPFAAALTTTTYTTIPTSVSAATTNAATISASTTISTTTDYCVQLPWNKCRLQVWYGMVHYIPNGSDP